MLVNTLFLRGSSQMVFVAQGDEDNLCGILNKEVFETNLKNLR